MAAASTQDLDALAEKTLVSLAMRLANVPRGLTLTVRRSAVGGQDPWRFEGFDAWNVCRFRMTGMKLSILILHGLADAHQGSVGQPRSPRWALSPQFLSLVFSLPCTLSVSLPVSLSRSLSRCLSPPTTCIPGGRSTGSDSSRTASFSRGETLAVLIC